MKKISEDDRVIFLPQTDLLWNTYFDRVNLLLDQKLNYPEDVNDAVELYQCKRMVESYGNYFDDLERKVLLGRKAFGLACKFIAIALKKYSLCDLLERCDPFEYREQLLCLIRDSEAYKKINCRNVREALESSFDIIEYILFQRELVVEFDQQIRDYLMSNKCKAAEILINNFAHPSYGGRRGSEKKPVAPKSLTVEDVNSIMLDYIKSNSCNLNYLNNIVSWSKNVAGLNYTPSREVVVEAKKKYDLEAEKLFSESYYRYTYIVSIDPKQEEYKLEEALDGGVSVKFGGNWLNKYMDYATILNNFIYIFDYFVDESGLLCMPSNPYAVNALISSISSDGPNSYPKATGFLYRNSLAISCMKLYVTFLKKSDIYLENVIEWVFNSYIKEELGIAGFSISLPSRGASALDCCKLIGPEIERILIAYQVYVEMGEVDPYHCQKIGFKNFSEIPSALSQKYAEPGIEFEKISTLLCSDQSPLAHSKEHPDAPPSFLGIIIGREANRNDFAKVYQQHIDLLSEYGIVAISDSGKISATSIALILGLIWQRGAVVTYKRDEKSRGELTSLEQKGWLKFTSNLFTQRESDYLSYMFNNAKFDDAKALRNKYAHGGFSVENPNSSEFEEDYIALLVVLMCVTLKIFDELHFNIKSNLVKGSVVFPVISMES